MSKLEKYLKYKDSGVEWIGEIPEGWEVKKIKYLFNIGRGRVISQQELDKNALFPVYSSQTKNNGILGYVKTFDYNCKQITWTTDGANAGTVFLREGKHNCTNVCGTLQSKKQDENLEFISYSLQIATQFYKRPDTNGAKIMNGEMAEIFIIYPPKQEQTKIANYLDQKTVQIDKAISLKEQMIERLKERRQILINDAVTKGLDKTVKMKDSGVEWLGEVPAHWEVKAIKYLLEERNERSETGEETLFMMSQRYGLVVRANYHDKAVVAQSSVGNKKVYKNDLVFNKLKAHLGVFSKSNIEDVGIVSPDYAVYFSIDNITDVKYLELLFKNPIYISHFIRKATGIVEGLIRLYTDDLFSLKVPVPPELEQKKILEYIDKSSIKIDKAISLQHKQIEKLKEYKAILTDSVVTGKVRIA